MTATRWDHWADHADRFDAMLGPIGHRMLDAAGLFPGAVVLDVGCGTGQTTVDAARRVSPTGRAIGVDVSDSELDAARRRADAAGTANIDFLEADASTHPFPLGAHHAIVSRFALMLLDDPAGGLAHLAGTLRAGGRLAFTCWQAEEHNGWSTVPVAAVRAHVDLPLGPSRPGGRCPFAFADPDRVRTLLIDAGFTGIELEDVRDPVFVGHDVDDAIRFFRADPKAQALAAASPELLEAVLGTLADALAPHATPEGVHLPAAAWLVTAERG